MSPPIALFSSCSTVHQDDIIKQILKVECLPEGNLFPDGILGYSWSIDTRYYTANICLCSTDVRTLGDAEFAENVQAFIVHFDTKDKESWDQVKRWSPFLKQIDPDIQLLICDTCTQGDAISKEEAWKWCLENSFELIELKPETSENSDEEDDFKETVGIERIIQALHSHSWPNLVMKEKPTYRSSLMTQMMRDEAKEKRELQALQDQSDTPLSSNTHVTTTQQNGKEASTSETTKREHHPNRVSDFNNPLNRGSSQSQESHHIWGEAEATVEQAFENNFVNRGSVSTVLTVQSVDVKVKNTDIGKSDNNQEMEKNVLSSRVQQSCDDSNHKDLGATDSTSASGGNEALCEEGVKDSLVADEDLQMLAALGDSDHLDDDSFEKLFDKLRVMKDQAEALPLEERKKYAEKVAVDFWRAIGGENEEIDGLSSDEDNFTL